MPQLQEMLNAVLALIIQLQQPLTACCEITGGLAGLLLDWLRLPRFNAEPTRTCHISQTLVKEPSVKDISFVALCFNSCDWVQFVMFGYLDNN